MSNNRKLLSHLFALNCALGGDSLEDIIFMSKDYIRDISVSLILEIRNLEEDGHTYEEILELINKCDFSEYDLSDEEKSFLRRDAKKTLKIVYKKGD